MTSSTPNLNKTEFNSIQFSLYNTKSQQMSSQGTSMLVQFKPIKVQFNVIIIQSNPINQVKNESNSYIQSQFKNNFLAKETNRFHQNQM